MKGYSVHPDLSDGEVVSNTDQSRNCVSDTYGSKRLIRRFGVSAVCPACERFVGAVVRCPYCDQTTFRAPLLLRLRITALLLALAGLVFLYAAPRVLPPLVDLSEITPMMNFARVRIRGFVERKPYIGKDDGTVSYVSFSLKSGEAKIRAKAYGQTARKLSESGGLPAAGQSVEVKGSLRLSGDARRSLILRGSDDVVFIKDLPAKPEVGG